MSLFVVAEVASRSGMVKITFGGCPNVPNHWGAFVLPSDVAGSVAVFTVVGNIPELLVAL